MVAGDLREDPVLAEQRHGDRLREQPRLTALDRVPQPPRRPPGRRAQLDRPDQAEPPHLADDLEPLGEGRGQLQ